MDKYDSTADTLKHIQTVQAFLSFVIHRILRRMEQHDDSKLYPPEKDIFNEYTPKLKGTTYGSNEYKQYLEEMKIARDHHYKQHRHNPEHFKNGINDMNLIDIIEMVCDWKAVTLRHNDGNIYESLNINSERFKIDSQLKAIINNTIKELNW